METKKINLTLLAFSIILIALNLRIPITSVGPDVIMIEKQYSLSAAAAGWITTIPLLVFATLSQFISGISGKYGYGKLLLLGLVLMIVGELVRSFLGEAGLFAGTLVIGLGIVTANVLIPSVIKHRFANKVGFMTSLYVTCMNIAGAIGVGATIPIAKHFGWSWQPALSMWVVLAIIALIFWIPFCTQHKVPDASELQADKKRIWSYGMAWWVSAFYGLQSIIFFSLITWLPSMIVAKGMTTEFATNLTFALMLFTIPTSILTPILCSKMKSQSALIAGIAAAYVVGLSLFIIAESHALLICSVIIISLTIGGCISSALLFFTLRSANTKRTTELSGLAQSVGYLMGALGPLLVGFMYDQFHSWKEALLTLIALAILMILSGSMAGRNKQIE